MSMPTVEQAFLSRNKEYCYAEARNMLTISTTEAKWFVLRVNARHEKSVSRMLNTLGYKTLLPLYKKVHQYGRRVRNFELPVFSEYVFCQLSREELAKAVRLPSVLGALGISGYPSPLEEEEIQAIEMAHRHGTGIAPWPYLKTGNRVRVAEGSFTGLIGNVIETKNNTMRVVVSVGLLRRSLLLEIDRVRIEPA